MKSAAHRPAEEWKMSWVEVCISLPLGTQAELQEVGVFLRQREIDQADRETCGGKVSDSVRRQGKVE